MSAGLGEGGERRRSADWRRVVLSDGREVEYLSAEIVDEDDDKYVLDVALVVDGVEAGSYRVEVDKREATRLLSLNSGRYYLDAMAQAYVDYTKRRALGADSRPGRGSRSGT